MTDSDTIATEEIEDLANTGLVLTQCLVTYREDRSCFREQFIP